MTAPSSETSLTTRPLAKSTDSDFYRIPSLFHTAAGSLLACCQRRKGASGDFGHDSDMLLSRSTDAGQTWSDFATLASSPGIDIHTGPIVQDRHSGRLLKFCRYWPADDGLNIVRSTTYKDMARAGLHDYLVTSEDDGVTWSDPTPIELPFPPEALSACTGNGVHGIQLDTGRLLIQAGFVQDDQRFMAALYSDDAGQTWHMGATTPFETVREYTMAPLPDGRVYFNLRSHRPGGHRITSISDDPSQTFGQLHEDTNLPEPVCHAGLVNLPASEAMPSGGLLFTNPAVRNPTGRFDAATRRELTLRLSLDQAKTWPHSRMIWPNLAGYSDVAIDHAGTVHMIFEAGETDTGPLDERYFQSLTYASCPLSWLTDKA